MAPWVPEDDRLQAVSGEVETNGEKVPVRSRARILFVFLDGVGLGPAGPHNPFSRVPMPRLRALLGGPLVHNGTVRAGTPLAVFPTVGARAEVVLRPVDACLGVPGLPQSATGQAALFTGTNAPALMGEHVTAFPVGALRELIADESVLKRAAEGGARVLFANAHSERFWQMIRQRRRMLGASTLTALAARAPIPTLDDLMAGRAVLWDITHEIAVRYLDYELPLVSPEEAGARLARLATAYDLILYESFLPDLAGHGRIEPEWVLERLDGFLGELIARCPSGATVVVCSDHGNMEDTSTTRHTANPVPLLAVGPAAALFAGAEAITDVAPAILSALRGAPASDAGQRLPR